MNARIVSAAFLHACAVVYGAEPPPSAFARHVVDDQFNNGYQVSVADIDRDGKPDILALSTTPSQLVWYKNPAWERIAITTKTARNIDLAPHDIDGDGDPDLALAYEFDLGNSTEGGNVGWLECPDDPAANQEWVLHPIGAIPTSHRVRWADLDGDGKPELLNLPILGVGAKPPEYASGLAFTAYRIPASPNADPWESVILDDTLHVAHAMRVVSWDADARADILTASFEGVALIQSDTTGKAFTRTPIGSGDTSPRPKQGSSEVSLGTAGPNRFIATIEPWHGNQVVVYTPEAASIFPWRREVIDTPGKDGHGLVTGDFNGDGIDEIVAGFRSVPYGLYLYSHAGEQGWQSIPIDEGGIGVAGLFVADINQDGKPDLVATGTATNNVVWYENREGR